jgi:polysaccharide biosynthesis/export protein
VLSPGVYPINPGKTKLSEVIAMTGGFAADAYPSLAEMYRPQAGSDGNLIDPDREYVRNLRLSILTMEDTLTYRTEARAREGIVSVDFYKLFVKGDNSADVPVFDGDIIIIPKNTMTVQVIGMVVNGGYVPWKQGAKLDYYIAKTNGYLEDASKSRVRVLKGNTRAWLEPEETEIEPGDLIWVHRNPQIRASNSTEVLAMLASVIAALAGIASLVISVLRK